MKEYATLVTDDVSSPYSYPVFSRRESKQDGCGSEGGMIQELMKAGWEVIDASMLPKLSTHDERPKFAFILERTAKPAGEPK